ncbi:non-hydrolyzing UDP-N-acetylglucosamine 2-epimerase [Cycloclasticus pugetii]|uniref:non-hydrolyzing UDP-N-acetylglucosamine 2-epimerase n=1 Tax=Cycloclasticus pugetii TaxID=34068 RepID=UPI00037688B6|nr:UDP-N-acetylglucosamine 2-epimerase (non-hydrolyzing) [Cycloclasticus pugetii]
MNVIKVITIIGARPQFIKASVVSRAFKHCCEDIVEVLVHTGQHYDDNMSKVFFDELGISKPDYNLGVGGDSHGQNTGRMIEKIEDLLLVEKPDWVLVYGDTDSTLAGALAAVKLHIPVVHIEAGLRSFNRSMPEEVNRVLTDHIATLLFAPTELAVSNLVNEGNEGIERSKIHLVGDVMYDAALYFYKKAEQKSKILETLKLSSKEYVLATIHRQENTDDKHRLSSIINGLSQSSVPVILPLHPRTKKQLNLFGINIGTPIQVVESVGYLDMIMLEKNARAIATDSGGVQKEAYFYQVSCVTLREETEWVELVEQGVNHLAGYDENIITKSMTAKFPHTCKKDLYGDGSAAHRIVNEILFTYLVG